MVMALADETIIDVAGVDVPAIGKAKTVRPGKKRKLRVSRPYQSRVIKNQFCANCQHKCNHNCDTCVYSRYYEMQKKRYLGIIAGSIKAIPGLFRDTIKDWVFSTVQVSRWAIPIWVWLGFLVLGPLWLIPFFIYIIVRGDAEQ